jgi:hypothetical protein
MRQQRILLALAPAILSITTIPPVSAQAFQLRTPVNFTLRGCTQLPAGLTVNGSGESFLVLTTRVDQDGNTVMERNTLVTGIATDSNGATYGFNYHNHATITVPPGGLPFSIATTDHFNLVGNGQASQLQVHFVATITVHSLSPMVATFDITNMHGDPRTCDPI